MVPMTTTSRPPSYQPRLIEHRDTVATTGGARGVRLPEQWLRGVLAGAEAVILGWLVVVIPAVATYIATAASPALGSAGWMEAARVGTAGWFLGHGAVLQAGEGTISIVPLGLTLLCAFLVAMSVRRARLSSWAPALTATGTYVTLSAALLTLTDVPGAPWGVAGATVVSAVGVLWGMRRSLPPLPARLVTLGKAIPEWVRLGWAWMWRLAGLMLLPALIALTVGLIMGFGTIVEVQQSLHADPVSTAVIVLAQLLVLPVLAVWALSYLLGPGFSVGGDTMFTPVGIESGPLPLVPVLGVLPEPGSVAAELPFVVGVGILVGALGGWWLSRRTRSLSLPTALGAGLLAVFGAVLVLMLLGWLAAGGIGAGAMSFLGPDPVQMAIAATWQLGSGALVVLVAAHPSTHQGAARAWRALRTAAR